MRGLGLLAGGLLLLGLLWSGGLAFQYFTADVRGAVSANEQIKAKGEYRIEAYDRFFNACASVQSLEANITAQRAELEATTDERRRGQLQTNLTAITAGRAEAANQYNADAAKSYTAGQFRDSSLPFHISPIMTEGNPTVCTA